MVGMAVLTWGAEPALSARSAQKPSLLRSQHSYVVLLSPE
jgi:hypothetical protein